MKKKIGNHKKLLNFVYSNIENLKQFFPKKLTNMRRILIVQREREKWLVVEFYILFKFNYTSKSFITDAHIRHDKIDWTEFCTTFHTCMVTTTITSTVSLSYIAFREFCSGVETKFLYFPHFYFRKSTSTDTSNKFIKRGWKRWDIQKSITLNCFIAVSCYVVL